MSLEIIFFVHPLFMLLYYITDRIILAIQPSEAEKNPAGSPTLINAFQLIGMSSCLDLSGFFEKEVRIKVLKKNTRFASNIIAEVDISYY